MVLTALVTAATLGLAVIRQDQEVLRDRIAAGQLSSADLVAGLTSLYVGGAQASTRELASRPEVWQALAANEPAPLRPELIRFVNIIPEIDSVTLYDTNGIPLVTGDSSPPAIGLSVAGRDWLQQVVTLQQPYLGLPERMGSAGQPIAPYAVPVFDGRDQLRGVVMTGISLAAFSEVIKLIDVGVGGEIVLLDLRGDGMVVAHLDPTRLLTAASGLDESTTLLRSRGRSVWEATNHAGEAALAAYAPAGGLPWGVLVLNPADRVLAPVRDSTQRALVLGIVAILAAGVLGSALAFRMTRPLLRLRSAASILALGRDPGPLQLTQRDEIGDLGRAFDQMAGVLSQRAVELEKANTDLQLQAWQLTLLSKVGTVLQSCANPPKACEVARDYLALLLPSTSGAVCLLAPSDPADPSLAPIANWGDDPPAPAPFAPDDCWALQYGQPYWTADTGRARSCKHLPAGAARNQLCIPLLAQGEKLGVICVSLTSGEAVTPEQSLTPDGPYQQTALALAGLLGVVLRNLALQETLRTEATRDPLTGLFNRRYLDVSLERELLRAARAGGALALAIFDLDHFKLVNDTYGHDVGDVLLREFAELLQTRSRGEDIAARFGGEEFLLVLPGASLEVAQTRAEQIRVAIRDLSVQSRLSATGATTVSVGVAAFPAHGVTAEVLFQAADAALYRAKDGGRDRVMVAEPAVTPPRQAPEESAS